MLLAIDIGNTNINFGLFNKAKLIRKFSIPTISLSSRCLKNRLKGVKVSDAIACSVVPAANKVLFRTLKECGLPKPILVGKDVLVPVKNLYRRPMQVGQDRLVNALAGISLFGAPLIAIDFGTAVTFDIVSKKGAYLGGVILPGLGISLTALSEHTALLPDIKLSEPKELIGGDTKSSMLSGIINGFASLTDGLIDKLRRKIGKNAPVIATGGNVALISRYCKKINNVDPDLTLKGLRLLYESI